MILHFIKNDPFTKNYSLLKTKPKKPDILAFRFDKKKIPSAHASGGHERVGEVLLRKYYVEHLKTQPEHSSKTDDKYTNRKKSENAKDPLRTGSGLRAMVTPLRSKEPLKL